MIHLSLLCLSLCLWAKGRKGAGRLHRPLPPSLNPTCLSTPPVHTPNDKQVLVINKMSWKDQPLGKVRLPLKGLALPIENAVPLEVRYLTCVCMYKYKCEGCVKGR